MAPIMKKLCCRPQAVTEPIKWSNRLIFRCFATTIAGETEDASGGLGPYCQAAKRIQKLKDDAVSCRDAWPRGEFAVLYDLKPVLVPSAAKKPWTLPWQSSQKLQEMFKDDFSIEESVVLSGTSAGASPRFAINLPARSEPDGQTRIERALGGSVVNSRKAFFVASSADASILSQCIPLLQWHCRSQFCPSCGGRTHKDPSGFKRTCPDCDTIHYPAVSPVAIVLVTHGDSCLVVRQPKFMGGMYSAIAGFVEPGESLETAVRREVAEEVGLEVDEVRYHSSQSWAFPSSSLMLGCHANLKAGTADQVSLDEAELEDSRWVGREEALKVLAKNGAPNRDLWFPPPMAIAHHLIRSWATQSL